MSKSNPLFVDSTKFRGDVITSQIELKDILIFDDEALFVQITGPQGVSLRQRMKMVEGGSGGYEARVLLHHLAPITFQFVIEKNGDCFLRSKPYSGHAQYAILESWQPVVGECEDIMAGRSVPTPSTHELQNSAAWAKDSSAAVRSLIDKWGL